MIPRAVWWRGSAAVGFALLAGGGWILAASEDRLPRDAQGTLLFVSDRDGVDSLYLRRLPAGGVKRLTTLDAPASEPAVSPDGTRAAFTVGGRVALVTLADGRVRFLTLGHDWKDGAPAWSPDGQALVVAARRTGAALRDLHRLTPLAGADPVRQPLTETPHVDESQPAVAPDGAAIVFVRDDNLYRLDLAPARRPVRLTGGFRKVRSPRFLPSGRILFLWAEEKEYGIEVVDPDGRQRETLQTGSVFYRSVAPSPDGRYLAATFTFDLGFRFWSTLGFTHREELRLLDLHGVPVADLAGSWRHGNHSAAWAR